MRRLGQVWIETVLYTLIGLALIGLTLGFVMPKINEARDRALVDQAINSLGDLDSKVTEVIQTGAGNIRQTEFLMKRGELYINASSDEIDMLISGLTAPYSEPGVEINIGRIKTKTTSEQGGNSVYLRAVYNANLTYKKSDNAVKFNPASTSYKFFIKNAGNTNGKSWIDIDEVSGSQ